MHCFVVVMQSFIMNSHEVFIHIHQGCFAGTGAIVRLPQCQWSKTDGYGKISQCITTTKHSKAKTVCVFLRIYCSVMGDSIRELFSEVINTWYKTITKRCVAVAPAKFTRIHIAQTFLCRFYNYNILKIRVTYIIRRLYFYKRYIETSVYLIIFIT